MHMPSEISRLRRMLRLVVESQEFFSAPALDKCGRAVENEAARLMLQTDDTDALAMLRKCHLNGSKVREAARTGAELVSA